MKIVNIKKFLRMVGIILGLIIAISFYLAQDSYSKGEIKSKNIYVADGDTLWTIASYEQKNNSYYENKDVRDIIYDIKQTNNIDNNSNLIVGQKLIINSL